MLKIANHNFWTHKILRANENGNLPSKQILCQLRKFFATKVETEESKRCSEFTGRDFINFNAFTRQELYSLLWIACDLKNENSLVHARKLCQYKKFSFVFDNPLTKVNICNAIGDIGGIAGSINDAHFKNLSPYDYQYLGKTLSSSADAILIDSNFITEENIDKIAAGSSVPVLNLRTKLSSPIVGLAHVLSLYERYEYLRRLKITYIGPGNDQLLHTYMQMFPKLGIHLRYLVQGTPDSKIWDQSIAISRHFGTDIQQFDNKADALFRTHCISAVHFEEAPESYHVEIKDVKEMELEWSLIHHNAYRKTMATEELLMSKESLTWSAVDNESWILKALLVAVTSGFTPQTPRPLFEGED